MSDSRVTGQSRTAFELLLDIDQRCRQHASRLPSHESQLQHWSGIGFRVGGHWYVAPMAEISEVLPSPRCTLVPGVKPWMAGVANVRGRLLPVIDLCSFFGHERSSPSRQRRVLVVDQADLFVGLLVDEVLGLQHFVLQSLDAAHAADVDRQACAYLQGHFRRERAWAVFSPTLLINAPAFMDVAL